MKTIRTSIIPIQPSHAKIDSPHEFYLEAICVFAAIGFFLDQDTYWKDEVVLRAGSDHRLDSEGKLKTTDPWFNWHYSPRNLSFNQVLDEFTDLFETIVTAQTHDKKVILPLSGGLDSRTQATALFRLGANVNAYSYEFENGYQETQIAKHIATACNFDFKHYTITKGYLWDVIDKLAELNQCYSDFTSPRQMGIFDAFSSMGDVFSLGHWGDVLFDDMKVEDHLPIEQQVDYVIKKLVKKGGLSFAQQLWESWALDGEFYDYLYERVRALLSKIDIPNSANARIRAFKSLYWAPRWTSVNLSVFESKRPLTLPYYDDRMCQFICSIPEAYLKNRQLQIAYIKKQAPSLAQITWQDQRPFNLNTFKFNKAPFNLPYRLKNKLDRTVKGFFGTPYIQRNWELQFLGRENESQLTKVLQQQKFLDWVPKSFVDITLMNFYKQPEPKTAHPLNMLLVLAKFREKNV